MLLKELSFAYFNFDSDQLPNKKIDTNDLMKELIAVYGEVKYILFDEIQNLPNWELFANRLHRNGYNLVITGSNANLLSKELATHLTGRHIPIEIMPFDFGEFLRAKNYHLESEKIMLAEERGKLLNLVEQYMASGGYPEIVVKNIDPKIYLGTLFDSILFKDVVERHKVKNSGQIDRLGNYLINNISAQYSGRKLARVLDFRSNITLEKYLGYLVEAYLAFFLQPYSNKASQRLALPRKIYTVDNGFIEAKSVSHSSDLEKLSENLVFIELIKKGYRLNFDLFYYKTRNNREIDFVIKKGLKIESLLQVSCSTNDLDTEKREIKALSEAADELKANDLKIITWDTKKEIKKDNKTIQFVPLFEWFNELSMLK